MLAFLAAAIAAASPSPLLESAIPWWEKITVTVDDKGKQQSCQYEFSLSVAGVRACDEKISASISSSGESRSGQYSKVTFERRFSPGRQVDSGQLQPGDELLGRQVMFLTIGASGSIDSCDVVATSGEMAFAYDCDEARKEQFRKQAESGARQAFMTILAYGHSERIV